MDFLNKLYALKHCEELDGFILDNIEDITVFFALDYDILFNQRFPIEDYIVSNSNCLNKLDYSKYYNSYFILSFLDYFERFKLPGGYQVLYQISKNSNLSIGERQEAAYMYLISINKATDHLKFLTPILNNLQEAHKREEDNEDNILISLANYLSNVISNTIDFNRDILLSVLQLIEKAKSDYAFLSNAIVDELLSVNIGNADVASVAVHEIIQKILRKKGSSFPYSKEHHLIEIDTDYCAEILSVNCDFDSIRKISRVKYNNLSETMRNRLAAELGRGVKIIDDADQLYAYMTLYGMKHKLKLQYAYSNCGKVEGTVNVIDWGCGQGFASMLLLEHYQANKKIEINSITLIEPSSFALKRAALHVKTFGISSSKIKTVNSDFDNLKLSDLGPKNANTHVHLFSNVLDMETFDTNNVLNILEQKFKGDNLMICVSPYITAKKTDLLDIFVRHFNKRYNQSFQLIHKVDIRNQDPTKAIRIIRVTI